MAALGQPIPALRSVRGRWAFDVIKSDNTPRRYTRPHVCRQPQVVPTKLSCPVWLETRQRRPLCRRKNRPLRCFHQLRYMPSVDDIMTDTRQRNALVDAVHPQL